MPNSRRSRTPRLQVELIVTAAASLCLLPPASASAHHRRSSLEAPPSEQSALETPTQGGGGETESGETGTKTGQGSEETGSGAPVETPRGRRGARAAGPCTVSLSAPSALAGEATPTLTGTLSCESGEAGEQQVVLYERLLGSPGYFEADTATTQPDGAFQLSPGPLAGNALFYVRADGARSARVRVQAAPAITIASPTPGTTLTSGGYEDARAAAESSDAVTFSGTLAPATAGATVALQRELGDERWQRIALGHVGAEGEWTILHTFLKPGTAHLRVVAHMRGALARTASNPVTYVIAPHRTRAITIQASTDPLAYGSPLTITGSVTGAPDQQLTLYAQSSGGAFAPVAQAPAEGNQYSFTETPLASTRYRVESATASSTVLAEQVDYALAPNPLPSGAKAGEPLSFTGTLTPAPEGQTVQLESGELSGLHGFHVIASATVSGSTYSIPYTFTHPGTQRLRVRVPGDAALATTTSEPFLLEVG